MTLIIKISVSLLPVFIFLLALVILDSYKLIKSFSLLLAIFAGCLTAIFCYLLIQWLSDIYDINITTYSIFGAPILEEAVKATYIVYLLRRKKIGFMVDAAILGFAVGSGFAFIENIYYLQLIESSNILIWLIRGFGTAVMHGGTTAIFAIISKNFLDRKENDKIVYILPGLFLAMLIHSAFNQFLLPPMMITILQLLVLPIVVIFIFNRSESSLQNWMELSLETDMNLIKMITSDEISETKIGKYLYSLKTKFPSTVVVDMLCFLKIYAELAVRVKGILMMKEAGFRSSISLEITEKFNELKYLEKSIGTTGKLALSPILKRSTQDLWQLYFLNKR